MSETSAHPYLRDPLLYITNLPAHVTDADIARALEYCVPFRPTISRDGSGRPLDGTIEFKDFAKGMCVRRVGLHCLGLICLMLDIS
jgi:polyadenylate-binding protein